MKPKKFMVWLWCMIRFMFTVSTVWSTNDIISIQMVLGRIKFPHLCSRETMSNSHFVMGQWGLGYCTRLQSKKMRLSSAHDKHVGQVCLYFSSRTVFWVDLCLISLSFLQRNGVARKTWTSSRLRTKGNLRTVRAQSEEEWKQRTSLDSEARNFWLQMTAKNTPLGGCVSHLL